MEPAHDTETAIDIKIALDIETALDIKITPVTEIAPHIKTASGCAASRACHTSYGGGSSAGVAMGICPGPAHAFCKHTHTRPVSITHGTERGCGQTDLRHRDLALRVVLWRVLRRVLLRVLLREDRLVVEGLVGIAPSAWKPLMSVTEDSADRKPKTS